MPNTVPVNATALPHSSRRAALGLFAGLSALMATPALVRAATSPAISAEDAELFALAEPIAAADAALEVVSSGSLRDQGICPAYQIGHGQAKACGTF
jgi:hypothetical protein